MKKADLHSHTVHSDGTFTPTELVNKAKEIGLSVLSITDHDTVNALDEAVAAAGDDLEIISGVEITVSFKDRELHVLGYGFDPKNAQFARYAEETRHYRLDRIARMIEKLKQQGVHVSLDEVVASAGEGSIGRPHLAEILLKHGHVQSMGEAFQRYIGDFSPCFVKGAQLTVSGASAMIQAAGGVVVLAHPHRLIEDEWIPELVAEGIHGIEVYHSDHNAGVVEKYKREAEKHNLLITGGSDFHGARKPKIALGSVTCPYEHVELLQKAIRQFAAQA